VTVVRLRVAALGGAVPLLALGVLPPRYVDSVRLRVVEPVWPFGSAAFFDRGLCTLVGLVLVGATLVLSRSAVVGAFTGIVLLLVSAPPVLEWSEQVTGSEVATRFAGLLILFAVVTERLVRPRPSPGYLWACARRAWERERWQLLALGGLCMVAAGIRLVFVSAAMRYDEAYTYTHYASGPLVTAVSLLDLPNNQVLHTALVWASSHLFGASEVAIRAPALAAGLGMVPAVYIVGRVYYSAGVGLLAAALVASNSWLVTYSTNARGYTLMALSFLLLLALAPSLVRGNATNRWLVFVAIGALALYTTTAALMPLAIVATWVAVSAVARRDPVGRAALKRLAIALAGIALTAAVLYSPARAIPDWLRSPDAGLTSGFVEMVWSEWNRDVPDALRLVLIGGFVASIVLHRRIAAASVPLPVAAGLVLGCVVLAQQVVQYTRVWLFLLPLYLVLASAGALAALNTLAKPLPASIRPAVGAGAALVLSAGLAAAVAHSRSPKLSDSQDPVRVIDGQAVAELLRRQVRPGDTIVHGPFAGPGLRYYLEREGVQGVQGDRHYTVCAVQKRSVRCAGRRHPDRGFVIVTRRPARETLRDNLSGARLEGVIVGGRSRVIGSFEWTRVYSVQPNVPSNAGRVDGRRPA
jgi:hypothetical protein